MLPLAYSLRASGTRSEYGHQLMVDAIREFCAELPGGEADYLAALRAAALELYSKASPPGTEFFVDKTPAYSLMPETLIRVFPDAKYIFLWRNPLAVAASVTESFTGGRWALKAHSDYFALGLPRLADAYNAIDPESAISVRYEDLVKDPDTTLELIFDKLGLPPEPSVTSSFADVVLKGNRRDHAGMARYQSVSEEPLSKWVAAFDSPLRRSWGRRYLSFVGAERLSLMGYSKSELLSGLADAPTNASRVFEDGWFMLAHLGLVNARSRLLRQPGGFRWI